MKIKRSIIMIFCLLLIIFLQFSLVLAKRYNLAIIFTVVLSCIPFYYKYDRSKVQGREVVLLSTMIALTVISRIIFIPLPSFKPVTVMVIICGSIFGCASGFMCGSLSALLSDFIFGIGPWTPFQMLSWGIIGFGAGKLKDKLLNNKIYLYGYSVISGIVFSLVMDLWSVLAYEASFNLNRYLALVVTSLPVMLVYVVSNIIFMYLLSNMMFRIMKRVKQKYGIKEGSI